MGRLLDFDNWSLVEGDSATVLSGFTENSFDACVTDPPYELGFMGKKWDASGIAFSADFWRAVLRVLKPGAQLLAFGGTRTYHRMTCAIEDAGFEIRDSLHWIYGTGFPKSKTANSGMPEGQGTALKPGHEPVVLARKPLIGTLENNIAAHGTGGLQIDACRIGTDIVGGGGFGSSWSEGSGLSKGYEARPVSGRWPANVLLDEGAAAELDAQSGESASKRAPRGAGMGFHGANGTDTVGRGHDDSGASRFFFVVKGDLCRECANGAEPPSMAEPRPEGGSVPSLAKANLSFDTNTRPASTSETPIASKPRSANDTPAIQSSESGCSPESQPVKHSPSNCRACGVALNALTATMTTMTSRSKSSASAVGATSESTSPSAEPGEKDLESARFRYVAKPSRKERDQGCDHLPPKSGGEATDREDDSIGTQNPRAGAGRTGGARNYHPTVKPVELMRYLVRLVTPTGGTVLDPFTGSGTTGIAARLEGRLFIGIEREPEYFDIAHARIAAANSKK